MKDSYEYIRITLPYHFIKYTCIYVFLITIIVIAIPSILVTSFSSISVHYDHTNNDTNAVRHKAMTADPSKQSPSTKTAAGSSKPPSMQNTEKKSAAANQQNDSTTNNNESISLGWIVGNGDIYNQLNNYKKLNTVSPTFATIDKNYQVKFDLNTSTMNTLKSEHKKSWGRLIIDNDNKTNVHSFLSNAKNTENIINSVYTQASRQHIDGINLDIENVVSNDRTLFSAFVKNLSTKLSQANISLSIDLPADPKGNLNSASGFDHKLLATYCDYIIFMGYDLHWSSDPVPGPVTSLNWLESTVQEFIKTGIPAKKIILGLPAYTRIWKENSSGKVVSDPALSLSYVQQLVTQNHRSLQWKKDLGEYYISYPANGLQYKIWMPTAKTFNTFLSLVPKYHLAGSAVWDLNLMPSNYWNQIYAN
ncbi:glycosyl hydrolase family 18 protein [Heyndrickxia ginsengihumi]|uniref:glycosyl hydrolase family 18 protein n=1 Tax=Heyndrickxia ginsengihumi TaxID=363870 RepID=UPI003D1FB95B